MKHTYTTICTKDWPALLIIALLGLLTYYPAFGHEFQTFWDDQWVVVNPYTEGGWTVKNIWAILSEFYHGQYAPLNQLYYTTLYSLFGYHAFVYHSGSILVHVLNSVMVYYLIRSLFRISGYPLPAVRERLVALLAAVVFVLHPVSVEAVAWIAASKILLYAFFYLLALLFYIRYTEQGSAGLYAMVLLMYVFSFGAKEQAVTLPLCLVLIDFIAKRDFRTPRVYLEKVPMLVLSLFFGYVTMLSQAAVGDGALGGKEHYPMVQRLVFACYSFLEYVTKCLVPVKLSYLYPFPNLVGEPLPVRFLMYPAVFAGLLICFWPYIRRPWVLFWVLFFLLHIGVTLHIIPIGRFAITADRYVYLSLIAVSFGLAYGVHWIWNRAQTPVQRYLTIGLLCVYLLGLGIYAQSRVWVWRDTDTLKKELRTILKNRKDYDQLMLQLKAD